MKLEEAGLILTCPNSCNPLDEVKIDYVYPMLDGQAVVFEISDADHHTYHTETVISQKGKASLCIKAGKCPGVNLIKTFVDNGTQKNYRRVGSFCVKAETLVRSENQTVNELFEYLKEAIANGIDIVKVNGKQITYHKAGDNSRENLAYPAFPAPAMRYFVNDMKSMFEVVYENQYPDGKLPDHIYGDGSEGWEGKRKIRSLMADLETGMISTLYKAWQAHGDDDWVKKIIPKLEKSLEYVTSAPEIFDKENGLIKRCHGLDEWDLQILTNSCFIEDDSLFVLMTGDTSSMFEACGLLSKLYLAIGNEERAEYWKEQSQYYYKKGNELFWDGVKYKHHIHLDPVDHGDFDESKQLTMSNSWAITRNFADHEKSISILNEYDRRQKETGDRFCWWSVQPGYPDKLKYFNQEGNWAMKQGEYANGGQFPWVGGELCRGAFMHGKETYAYNLLCDLHSLMKKYHGGLFTWYDSEGNAGMSSPYNQTNYDLWGIQPWTQALIEDLWGIQSKGKLLEEVVCIPRWPAAKTDKARVTAHFPSSDKYFSYDYACGENEISIWFTGTGKKVCFKVLLPDDKNFNCASIDGVSCDCTQENIEDSKYLLVNSDISGVHKLVLCSREV